MSPMAATGKPQTRGTFDARVLTNRPIGPGHCRLVLGVAGFGPSRPGQFVNVLCNEPDPPGEPKIVDWPDGQLPRLTNPAVAARQPLLRRPLSLAGRADRDDGTAELTLIHRVVGAGTAWLAEAQAGQVVSVLGPLGNGFTIHRDRALAAVIGGGVGIPPMLYLAEALTAAGVEVVAFAGARSAALLPLTLDPAVEPADDGRPTRCAVEFAERGAPAVVATDDGSAGVAGMVHEAFAAWLRARRPAGEDLAVYACGPEPMMRAVADVAAGADAACELALERHMACGIGTCQGCVVKIKADTTDGWTYKLVCTDGPVFKAEDIVWD